MKNNAIFNINRFTNLLKLEFSSGYKLPIIVAIAIFSFLLFIGLIIANDGMENGFFEIWYGIVLLAGGFVFTSTVFDELNTKERRMDYLSLPASTLEKFIVKLLISSLGYAIVATLLFWIYTLVLNGLSLAFWGYTVDEFSPFDFPNSLFIKLYLVNQAIYLLGAVVYNKYSFFKTQFALFVLYLILMALGLLLFRIVFYDLFDGLVMPNDNGKIMPSRDFQDFAEFTLWPLLQNIFWFVLPPILWTIAYFKLKEREA